MRQYIYSFQKALDQWLKKLLGKMKDFGKKIILGFDPKGRFWRYLIVILIGLGAIWGMCMSYIIFTPKTYESKSILILPGAGAGASINIEDIGQATTTTASAYSSSSLSPTENYKRILMSYKIIDRAALILNISSNEISSPKIKLVDQTSLIFLKSIADSPEKAQLHGTMIISSLKEILNELRTEESRIREFDYKQKLKELKQSVKESRRKLLEHQALTGLVSVSHFHSIVEYVENIRQQAQQIDSKLNEKIAEKQGLITLLNRTPNQTTQAIILSSDPIFQSLTNQLVKIETNIAAIQNQYADNHPELKKAKKTQTDFREEITKRGQFILEQKGFDFNKNRDLSIKYEQGQLYHQLTLAQVEIEALKGHLKALTQQIKQGEERVKQLTLPASVLDDLIRDHQITETVFASILAKIDTTRTDFYASYPLVQVYESPSLNTRAVSPKSTLMIIGGSGATCFYLFGIIILCLRRRLILSLLRNI